MHQTDQHKTNQPHTSDRDVSESDPSFTSQAEVGDGMDNSQVVLHTGEAVKQWFSNPRKIPEIIPNCKKVNLGPDGNKAENAAQDPNKLHDNKVVDEDVWVTRCCCCEGGALPPPFLETQVQNQDTDWKYDKDACQVE